MALDGQNYISLTMPSLAMYDSLFEVVDANDTGFSMPKMRTGLLPIPTEYYEDPNNHERTWRNADGNTKIEKQQSGIDKVLELFNINF
jgi:hypothetical protein